MSPVTQLPELSPPRLVPRPSHPARDKLSGGETGSRPSSRPRKVPVPPALSPQEAFGGGELCTQPAVLHGGTTAESVGTGAGRSHGGGSAIETRRREQQPWTGACAQAECPGGVMLGGCIHPPPRRVPPGGVRTGHGAAQAVGAGPGSSHRGGRPNPRRTVVMKSMHDQTLHRYHIFLQQTRAKLRSEPMSGAGLSSALTASEPLPTNARFPPRSPAHLVSRPLGRALCRLLLPLTVQKSEVPRSAARPLRRPLPAPGQPPSQPREGRGLGGSSGSAAAATQLPAQMQALSGACNQSINQSVNPSIHPSWSAPEHPSLEGP